jgi:VWFA-related protein
MARHPAVAAIVVAGLAASLAGRPLESRTRVVYITVLDRNGTSVPALTAGDFTIKEAGQVREIVDVAIAQTPMRIAILVDDNGTGIFRAGVVRFIQRLQGRAEFALSTVAGQHLKLVDYTSRGEALVDAIGKLAARPGTPDGGQLLEGIFETARDFEKRPTERPVIVVLTVGGEEHSTLPAHHVLDQLKKSGATLHVIAFSSSPLRSTVAVQKPAALLAENLNLSEVLGDGPKQSGGSRGELVASAGLVLGLHELAEQLLNQYAVSFVQPDSVKAFEKLDVAVRKPGVTVRAPARMRGR